MTKEKLAEVLSLQKAESKEFKQEVPAILKSPELLKLLGEWFDSARFYHKNRYFWCRNSIAKLIKDRLDSMKHWKNANRGRHIRSEKSTNMVVGTKNAENEDW